MNTQQVAIVTGGAGGLGYVIADTLAYAGYKPIIFDRSAERLARLDANRFVGMQVDVTQETEVVQAVNDVIGRFGAVHVLVNNAGTIFSAPVLNIMSSNQRRHSYDAFKQNVDINLNAVFLMGSVVAESMAVHRINGVIVNISSISAAGNAGQSAYSAAKAGVEAMTKVWSKELGLFGIRVAAVAPGFMDTDSTRSALSAEKIQDLCRKIPLRRLGTEKNVAMAVMSVIENDFINGAVISVDGGMVV